MASNLERKWRMLVESSKRAGSENVEGGSCRSAAAYAYSNALSDAKGKKRKAEGPATKVAPPAKKVAVAATAAPSSKTTVVKKEAKGVVKEVKDAKSDQSFFSAPKQKPKLPSFKKAPPAPAVKKEPDQNVAQPSSINPFEEALKLMKSRKDSPATATPPPAPPQSAPPVPTVTISAKTGKLKKTVTWAPEGKLEMIKLIERAVYDDDPSHVSSFLVSAYVQYIKICIMSSHREHTVHTTSATLIETRVPPCTRICSKSLSSGQSHTVSVPPMFTV